MLDSTVVTIDGLIGAGKSTLVSKMKNDHTSIFFEDIPKNLLEIYYSDQKKYAAVFQSTLYSIMNSRMDSIISKASDDLMLIFDRSAISCIIFTRALQIGGILSDNDIEMLSHSFRIGLANNSGMKNNNLSMVYLYCSPQTALDRCMRRGRPEEAGVTLEYQQNLARAHLEFMVDMSRPEKKFYKQLGVDDGLTMPCFVSDWTKYGDPVSLFKNNVPVVPVDIDFADPDQVDKAFQRFFENK